MAKPSYRSAAYRHFFKSVMPYKAPTFKFRRSYRKRHHKQPDPEIGTPL